MNILLVDDDEEVLKALGLMLSFSGFQSLQASCGREALILAREHDFDLIVMDVAMPGMSGIELLGHLRQNEKTRDVPVIFFTAQAEQETREQAFALGAVDYLSKPVDFGTLRSSIQRALSVSLAL